jgi:hypothetical protein
VNATLPRHILGSNGSPTLGRLVTDDGFSCVTLERSASGDHPCVPAGTYTVELGLHHPGQPHGYPCPVITNVPHRTAIHVHVANRAEELQGCVATGEREADDGQAIEQSKHAFDRFMAHWALSDHAPFTLTITDP